jgi:hypothetical protein
VSNREPPFDYGYGYYVAWRESLRANVVLHRALDECLRVDHTICEEEGEYSAEDCKNTIAERKKALIEWAIAKVDGE